MDRAYPPINNLLEQATCITGRSKEATEDEIVEYMEALGFEMDYIDEFHNDQYEVFDAVPNNVLYGIDKDLYFIDTQIRLKM